MIMKIALVCTISAFLLEMSILVYTPGYMWRLYAMAVFVTITAILVVIAAKKKCIE